MRIFAEKLLTPGGWRENMCVFIEDGMIRSMEPGEGGDERCAYLTAGLFDTHQHGGEGFSAKYADMDQLRDYLVRLAQELERAERSEAAETQSAALHAQERSTKALREQASSLKALIIKNANELAEAAVSVLSMNDDEYSQLRKGAYKVWQERFDAERNFKDFYRFINEKL